MAAQKEKWKNLGEWVSLKWQGIKDWFVEKFTFSTDKKEGEGFSFSKLISDAITSIGDWFSDLFDQIVNFDFMGLAKDIMPETLFNWIFGSVKVSEKDVEKVKAAEEGFDKEGAEKSRKELVSAGLLDEDLINKDNLEIEKIQEALAAATGNSRAALVSALTEQLGDTAIAADERAALAAVLEKEKGEGARIIKGKARGAIVTKPAYLPSSGTVVGEHASWSGGKGAYAGGFAAAPPKTPDGGDEAIIPLEGQRGGSILAEALAPSVAGAVLNQMQMERMIGGDRAGAAAPPAIIDSSTVNNVTNNTVVRSPSPSGPNLHFEGRDFVHKIA